MIKQIVKRIVFFPRFILNRFILFKNKVSYKKTLEIIGVIFVQNSGSIVIGNNVTIRSSCTSNPIGGNVKSFFQVLKNGRLTIGDGTRISNCAITCSDSISIGENVYIGAGVKIYDTDFHPINYEDRINRLQSISHKPIVIKDGSFIGAHSIILKGVTIGKQSVIGAGSVVTKNIPDGEIWAGNPASIIKKIEDK